MGVVGPYRFDVYLIDLDPTVGREMQKTRPCVVVSPDEMNQYLSTVIVAPLTSRERNYPTRVQTTFESRRASIALDQLRTVDRVRLAKRLGVVDAATADQILAVLNEMFAP